MKVDDVVALPKISSDAHVEEPHNLWYERLDESLREFAPRRIQSDETGSWTLVVDGDPIGWAGMSAEDARAQDEARIAAIAPEVRFDMMRTDGTNGEIVIPTIGMFAWGITHAEVGRACCRIYNDWIRERLGGHQRIKLAAMLPTWEIAMAVEEIERVVGDPDIGALLLPLVGTPEWNMPHWEPLWKVLSQTGKPVMMHQGTGHDMLFYRGWGSPTANVMATQSMASRATALLACGGVLERYPDLHFVLVEVNGGWLAWTMHTLDEYYQAHAHLAKPKLAELPSEYVRRQIHATFQDDPVGLHNIPLTGSDCLMWGNDYPHAEGIYPNSNKVLAQILTDVSYDDAVKVTSGNAAKLFGFDKAVLDTRP
jgi:predicted TIM-barrel fold metal-dependent hydrolase